MTIVREEENGSNGHHAGQQSGEPLLAAHAPIAAWPNGVNHGPPGGIGRNREPCWRLMVARSPAVPVVGAGRAASNGWRPP